MDKTIGLFILVILLILVSSITLVYYDKVYVPEKITQEQYDLYVSEIKEDENFLPEDINSLFQARELASCPKGKCVIDRVTGVKRCPEGDNSLVYNINEEACTDRNLCELSSLPFSVNSDGSTTTRLSDVDECRCINKELCPSKDLVKFRQYVPDYSFYSTTNNYDYIVEQISDPEQQQFGYQNIEIDKSDETCSVNPKQTDHIRNGCDFSNTETDPLECNNFGVFEFGELYNNELNEIGTITAGESDKKITVRLSNQDSFSLTKGFFRVNNTVGKVTEVVFCEFETDQITVNTVTLNIKNKFLASGEEYTLGLKSNDNTQIYLLTERKVCGVDTTANYRNMLMCIQPKRNICERGIFSYNYVEELPPVDQTIYQKNIFSRRFCQKKYLGDKYLSSPISNSISCTIGSGCNAERLEEDGELEEDKYFEDFDISGARNVLKGILNTHPTQSNKSLVFLDNSKIYKKSNFSVYNPNKVFKIEKYVDRGDCWSVLNVANTTYTTEEKDTGDTISVSDLSVFRNIESNNFKLGIKLVFGVSPGTSFSLTGVCFKTSSIDFDPVIDFNVPNLNPVTFYFSDTTGLGGVVKKDKNILSLCNFNGDNTDAGSVYTYNFYKQFGFNGFNYNTTIRENTGGGEIQYLRKNKLNYPTPTSILNSISELGSADEQLNALFLSTSFRNNFTMYYPVWNPTLFRQECIRCKPSLFIFPEILVSGQRTKIVNVGIQYSGRDFLNYEYHNGSKSFHYTNICKLEQNNRRSTTGIIYLDQPNYNIRKDDYVLDSKLKLKHEIGVSPTDFNSKLGFPNNENLIIRDLMKEFGINESTHSEVFYEEEILEPSGLKLGLDLNEMSDSDPENYFFGKIYSGETTKGVSQGVYIIPEIQVTNISDDKKIITTNSSNIRYLDEKGHVQFSRLNEKLELSFINKNIKEVTDVVKIDKISDGRITNIIVTDNEKENSLSSTERVKINIKNYEE